MLNAIKNQFIFHLILLVLCSGFVYSQVPSPLPHPGYDYVDINPSSWADNDISYGGIAFLEDGRMVALYFPSQGQNQGRVHLFSNVLTATSGADIETEEIATNLNQPLGVHIVDGTIYITEKDQLGKIEPNGNGWDYSMAYNGHDATITEAYNHWFSMGLLYHEEKFYWSLGAFYSYQNDAPDPERHGTVVEYDPANDSHEFLVHGFRNTGGMGLGPEGAICTNDNQGDWEPSGKVICIEEGNWYGYYGQEAQMRDGREESPPTIWSTHQNINSDRDHTGYGRSPGEMLMLEKGVFAGQMLMADVTTAWLTRLFFEKMDGHWQGANFNFGGGFNSGTWRLILAPDQETLIVGGMGIYTSGGWAYPDTTSNMDPTRSSLHRLEPNGTETLELLAIRSLGPNEMEVEFTMPVNAAAAEAGNYIVSIWWNETVRGYGGGHKTDLKTINVTSVDLSTDGTKAVLTFADNDLYEGSVVRIEVDRNNVEAQDGTEFWYWYGDYTLTRFGPADVVGVKSHYYVKPVINYSLQNHSLGFVLNLAEQGTFDIKMTDLNGKVVLEQNGLYKGIHTLKNSLPGGVYFFSIGNDDKSDTRKVSVF